MASPEVYLANTVDWNNPAGRISKDFTVHEALWLNSWRVYHTPSEEEKENIVRMAAALQKVRDQLKRPIIVHCWIRPLKANCPGSQYHRKNYNKFVGSTATTSAHIDGRAVDYHVSGFSGDTGCQTVRNTLVPMLEEYGLRMENKVGAWIHNDIAPVKVNRFFVP